MVVLEDERDGEEEGSDRDPFDELDLAIQPGGGGLDQGSQTGRRVHLTQIPLQPTRPHQEV